MARSCNPSQCKGTKPEGVSKGWVMYFQTGKEGLVGSHWLLFDDNKLLEVPLVS